MVCGVNGHFGQEYMLSTKDLRNKPEPDLAATQVVEGEIAMVRVKSLELFLMAQHHGTVSPKCSKVTFGINFPQVNL